LSALTDKQTFDYGTRSKMYSCTHFFVFNNSFTCFSGTVFVIPVFGGYVADSMAGKYNTILGSGLIYTLGRLERFLCSIG